MSPFSLDRIKPPEPHGCLIFGGFSDCPHPHKQETRGLDANTGYFLLFLVTTSLLSKFFLGKRRFIKKKSEIRKNPEKSQA